MKIALSFITNQHQETNVRELNYLLCFKWNCGWYAELWVICSLRFLITSSLINESSSE
jgi:hypothetical protein